MARLPLRCTHSPQREVWHRGPKDRSPCLEMARLCLSCRQVARSLGMNLRWPDGSPWFEPWTAQTLTLPVVDGPPVLLPSTGGEVVVSQPVEVEHPVEDEKKTCKAEEGCDRPVKAKGYCGSHYEKVFRRNGRGRVEKPSPPAPGDSGGPLVAAKPGEIQKLEKEVAQLHSHLAEVRQTLAPLLGVARTTATAVSMASRVAQLVARLQAATPATGRDLEEELAGAVADLEMTDARLRAWELWHQESEGGGNPTLLAGLLRLTRGARA